MADIVKIYSSTPVKNFPDIYNANNDTLLNKISTAASSVTTSISAQNQEITKIKADFNTFIVKLQEEFDERMDEYEANIAQYGSGTGSINLSDYVKKTELAKYYSTTAENNAKYLTKTLGDNSYIALSAVSTFAKKTDLPADYLTESDMEDFVTMDDLEGVMTSDKMGDYVKTSALSSYLTTSDAASKYLTIESANKNLLTAKTAASVYLKVTVAASTYVSKSELDEYCTSSAIAADYLTKVSAESIYMKKTDTPELSGYVTLSVFNACKDRLEELEEELEELKEYIRNHTIDDGSEDEPTVDPEGSEGSEGSEEPVIDPDGSEGSEDDGSEGSEEPVIDPEGSEGSESGESEPEGSEGSEYEEDEDITYEMQDPEITQITSEEVPYLTVDKTTIDVDTNPELTTDTTSINLNANTTNTLNI